MPYVLENLQSERRAVGVCVYLGVGVLDHGIFLNATLRLDKLWSKRVDSLPVMIIAFEGVAMSDTGSLLERNPATSITTHSILILDSHDFLGEITLVHIKIQTVHCHQFGKRYVICLLFVVW